MNVAVKCPEISNIKNAKQFLSEKSRKLFAQYNILLWPKNVRKMLEWGGV